MFLKKLKTEVSLQDLPGRVYIRLKEPFRFEFFNYVAKRSGSMAKLAASFGITCQYIHMYEKGVYSIPLRFVEKLLDICPKNERNEILNKLQNNVEEIKLGPKGNPIINPKLPIRFSPTLAQIAGHIIGDGGIRKDLIARYTNQCDFLHNQFMKDILTALGNVKPSSYRHADNKKTKTIVFPGIVGLILTKFLGRQRKEFKHIPEIILHSDKNSKSLFLRALFDDEGSVNISPYTISFKMASKKIIGLIKELLMQFDIKTSKTIKIKGTQTQRDRYQFYISGKANLERFNSEIGFDNPMQKEKLNILLKKYWKYQTEEFRTMVIKSLKENDKMNFSELAKKLNRKTTSRLRQRLIKLEKEGVINTGMDGRFKIYFVNY